METEMVIEPIEAIRLYRYNPFIDKDALSALYSDNFYRVGNKYRAAHKYSSGMVVEDRQHIIDCGMCGFYAVKEETQLYPLYKEICFLNAKFSGYLAMGPVLLSDIVVEHEFGYRANEMTVLPIEKIVHVLKDTPEDMEPMPRYGMALLWLASKHAQMSITTVTMNEWREAMKGDGDMFL